MKIYGYGNEIVFEGTAEEGRKWVLSRIKPLGDGRKIYRLWKDGDYYFVDAAGPIYWAAENFMHMPEKDVDGAAKK